MVGSGTGLGVHIFSMDFNKGEKMWRLAQCEGMKLYGIFLDSPVQSIETGQESSSQVAFPGLFGV